MFRSSWNVFNSWGRVFTSNRVFSFIHWLCMQSASKIHLAFCLNTVRAARSWNVKYLKRPLHTKDVMKKTTWKCEIRKYLHIHGNLGPPLWHNRYTYRGYRKLPCDVQSSNETNNVNHFHHLSLLFCHTIQGDETHKQSTGLTLSFGAVKWHLFCTRWLVDVFIRSAKARGKLPFTKLFCPWCVKVFKQFNGQLKWKELPLQVYQSSY